MCDPQAKKTFCSQMLIQEIMTNITVKISTEAVEKEPEKNLGLNTIRTHDPAIRVQFYKLPHLTASYFFF